MNIEHHKTLTNEQYLEDIWELLCRYDHAFIPPLSARENTYQSNLSGGSPTNVKPKKYFEMLKEQSFLVALVQDRVVGFMSYRPRYVCQDLEDGIETTYVTTIIVEEEQRGQGITTSFYKQIFALIDEHETVTTRTWSTNHDHIRVLMKLGFELVKTIDDSRGEGIDTVYFRKIVKGGPHS